MKRVILSAIAAACFVSAVTAQVPSTSEEYNNLLSEWILLNNGSKDAAYAAFEGFYETIKTEFPIDPAIAQAVAAIRAQGDATVKTKAKEMGFDNFKDAFDPTKNSRYQEIRDLQESFYTQERALTSAYNEEFQRRYQQACIDAMKRLMENIETMKK